MPGGSFTSYSNQPSPARVFFQRGSLVADDLLQAVAAGHHGLKRRTTPHQVVETLEAQTDFPDVRQLVNSGQLSFGDVLKIRNHARRFREWLQTQAERDRDALLAYHHEVAHASGFARTAGKTLRLFGTLAAAGVGAAAGAAAAGPPGAAVGVAAGGVAAKAVEEGVKFVFDVAGKLDEDWKPVVFGDWMRTYVANATKA